MTYKVDSPEAEEFIHHEEILETLEYARTNKDNRALIEQLIEKAALCKGLTHREAAVLLECDQPDLIEHIFHLAKEIKQKFYGNRIVMFAPLYLSNYCVNGCTYCPYHAKNKTIARKKLTQEEVAGYLGVTAPAVNKWENGNSFPDISLLAPIARLLGISTDTLLSYREELTDKEIQQSVETVGSMIKAGEYHRAFQ